MALLLFWSTILTALDGVDVEALLTHRRNEIRALEVQIPHDPYELSTCDPGAPPWIIVRVGDDGFIVGDEGKTPLHTASIDGPGVALRALKDARREREAVVMDVDDDVSHARLIAVVDLLYATDLKQLALSATPTAPRPTMEHWVLPLPMW